MMNLTLTDKIEDEAERGRLFYVLLGDRRGPVALSFGSMMVLAREVEAGRAEGYGRDWIVVVASTREIARYVATGYRAELSERPAMAAGVRDRGRLCAVVEDIGGAPARAR